MNTVIPEFVKRVNFAVGNFGSAGSAHMEFFKTMPENFVTVEGGMYAMGEQCSGYRAGDRGLPRVQKC